MTTAIKEGFWRSEFEINFPFPKSESEPVNSEFTNKLQKIEQKCKDTYKDDEKNMMYYWGFSRCRICQKPNGSSEYYYNGYCWPQGYLHYLLEHNVHPSSQFYKMVMTS